MFNISEKYITKRLLQEVLDELLMRKSKGLLNESFFSKKHISGFKN